MIPENRLSTITAPDSFLNPWSPDPLVSFHWGPVAVQDPSQGLLVKIWTAYVEDNEVYLTATGVPPFLYYTHTHNIERISLAFNQNGDPHLAFFDTQARSYLYWFNSLTSSMTLTQWPVGYVGPTVTLDDARRFNAPNSDVIFGYVRAGALRYRIQRERFEVEYTPPVGPGGPPLAAGDLYHISMQDNLVVGFLVAGAPFQFFETTDIMKKAIIIQKAPAETFDVTYDFNSLMQFNDPIEAAKSVMTLESGTDATPSDMLNGSPTYTDHTATQSVTGGVLGNIYRLAISVRTQAACIYVIEGMIYVNNSPAEAPAP